MTPDRDDTAGCPCPSLSLKNVVCLQALPALSPVHPHLFYLSLISPYLTLRHQRPTLSQPPIIAYFPLFSPSYLPYYRSMRRSLQSEADVFFNLQVRRFQNDYPIRLGCRLPGHCRNKVAGKTDSSGPEIGRRLPSPDRAFP